MVEKRFNKKRHRKASSSCLILKSVQLFYNLINKPLLEEAEV